MSAQNKFPKYNILGCQIDRLTLDEAVEYVITQIKGKKPPAYMVKVYVELLDRAASDPSIKNLLNESTLSVPEGVSTQWAASYLYNGKPGLLRALALAFSIILNPRAIKHPIPEKFGGTVFTLRLLDACERKGVSVYLIGSPVDSDITATEKHILNRFPNLKIAGSHPGSLGALSGSELEQVLIDEPVEKELVEDILLKKPDVVFVGMGFPLQEKVIAKIISQVKHGFFIGEGGTFDYDEFGGVFKKAPKWVQRIGMEWLWRLSLQPSRYKRQYVIPKFMWHVYRSKK